MQKVMAVWNEMRIFAAMNKIKKNIFFLVALLSVLSLHCHADDELITRNLISDPFVTSEIVNFTFSVLGEASKVGTIEVKGKDRVTILEAIAQAGDLTNNAQLDRIAVIREENGKRRVHYVNILSKSIFDSPVYYLKQNDLIYVEPNNNRAREESRRNFQWIFAGASVITTVFTIINLFKK